MRPYICVSDPAADPHLYSSLHSQGLSSRYNGTVQKVHDISGDASAKLHALSSVLLEQLGELQVGPPPADRLHAGARFILVSC